MSEAKENDVAEEEVTECETRKEDLENLKEKGKIDLGRNKQQRKKTSRS